MNIRWSQISIHDNFIEKGIVPNFVIHAMDDEGEGNATYSNLNFSDNKFICYNTENRIPVDKINEYDILLKTRHGIAPYSIDLARNYRVSANKDLVSFHPTGIMLATQDTDEDGVVGDIQPFKAFNDHSYFLSDRASIRRNLKLKQSSIVSSVPTLTMTAMNNSNIPKLTKGNFQSDANATYRFSMQVIVDETRKIAGNEDIEATPYPAGSILNYISNGKSCGILLTLNWKGEETACKLRIVRDTVVDGNITAQAEVTVPVCGARFLHDNSVSVEGHLWKSIPLDTGFITAPNLGLKSVQFIDDNVSCCASATPVAGVWKPGDTIVIKPSGNSSSQEWVDTIVRMKK